MAAGQPAEARTTQGFWTAAQLIIGQLLLLIAEYGIAPVLIAAGLTIPIFLLFEIPSGDWQTNVVLLLVAGFMIAAGSAVRIAQMNFGLFSGRTTLLICASCERPLTQAVGIAFKPPQPIQCSHDECRAVNIIQ